MPTKRKTNVPGPSAGLTVEALAEAHEVFQRKEHRDLFYRAASDLVEHAFREASSLNVAETLAVVLQTWNRSFYRYHRFDEKHLAVIEQVLDKHAAVLAQYRPRRLDSLQDSERYPVALMFDDLETVLGPAGAAQALHLIAPRFFAVWDNKIGDAYGLKMKRQGPNGETYYGFLQAVKDQTQRLGGEDAIGRNPVKALDEYNLAKFSNRWLK